MKKYPVIALAALAGMFFASCDEYTLPNPPAQSNPEESTFESSDLTLTNRIDGLLNLPTLREEGLPVSFFDVDLKSFPESYELKLVGEFSATEEFTEAGTRTASITVADNVGTMTVGEVQSIFNELVSKSPEQGKLYMRVPAYAVSGTSDVRLGGPDVYYYTKTLDVLPVPQGYVIETGYYLVGSFCGWDIAKGLPFTQTIAGNPYDNPEFMVKIDVTAQQAAGDGYQWKIVPKSGFDNSSWAGALGCAKGEETSGDLVSAPEAQTDPGVIKQEGPYIIKVNLEKQRYTVEPAFEYLWVPGYGSSVSDFNKIMRLTTNDYIHYEGTMRLFNRFWFTGQASITGVNFRPDGEDNPVGADGVLSGKMKYDPTTTGTMKVPGAGGLYYIKANVITLEWSATPIPVLNIVGGFNGWNQTTAPALTPNANKNVWTITETFAEAGEFKFCVNNSWDLSYGTADGTFDSVVQNAGNYKIETPGTYEISVHFDVFPNYVSVVAK